ALVVETDLVGLIELRLGRGAAVARVADFAGAGDRGDATIRSDPADDLVVGVADVECPIWAANQARRPVHLRLDRWAAIAGIALLAVARDDFSLRRRNGRCRDKEAQEKSKTSDLTTAKHRHSHLGKSSISDNPVTANRGACLS